ncbi:MAG TPA: hypothetical protein VGC95_02330 [Chitinophagaceae bacterium]
MKQIVSAYCCFLCFHSVRAVPGELAGGSSRTSGEKVIVKALSALVNRDGNQKIKSRRVELSASEWPWA